MRLADRWHKSSGLVLQAGDAQAVERYAAHQLTVRRFAALLNFSYELIVFSERESMRARHGNYSIGLWDWEACVYAAKVHAMQRSVTQLLNATR